MAMRKKYLTKEVKAQLDTYCREVRRRRENLGLTLEALGQRAALTPNYIGSIEMGRRDPSLSTVFGIANGLGVEPSALLTSPDGLSPVSIEAAQLYEGSPPDVRPVLSALIRTLRKRA